MRRLLAGKVKMSHEIVHRNRAEEDPEMDAQETSGFLEDENEARI